MYSAWAHQNNRCPGYRPKGKHKRQLYLLQSLPNIGPNRAENLLNTFHTIENISAATPKDLSQTPGISYPTAQKIHDFLHDKITPWGSPTS